LKGFFSLVLHTHMPYVRKNGAFPVGEDWLYQAMSDTYLPLIEMLRRLESEGATPGVGLTVTPILSEQLADPYIKDSFVAYLKTMAERSEQDIEEFVYFKDDARKRLAEEYRESFRRKLAVFAAIDRDIPTALSELEQDGIIETIGSSATHAFLPALEDERSVRLQVVTGLESHRMRFGSNPAGFWLPECAYRRGVEELLESEGVRYVLLDPTALRGRPSTCPYLVGNTGLVGLARSETAHRDVWDDKTGYPTGGAYLDSTKYYQNSGLLYWRVTGTGVPIENKAVYDPDRARKLALDHARHFIARIERELEGAGPCAGPAGSPVSSPRALPLVLASYDTELFGHGWREGFYWMEVLLRSLAVLDAFGTTTPSGYLSENRPAVAVELAETTWGTGHDSSTWVNPDTRWMWVEIGEAQRTLFELVERYGSARPEWAGNALKQAAREVLLLESSDWPYMVAKDRASNYATQRFNTHFERFRGLAVALERGDEEEAERLAAGVEEVDNIFSKLDLGIVSEEDAPRGTEGR
jgi:1,4-alpha-glucan branching enzyme